MPLNPKVEVRVEDGLMIAEFWDCLRLDPAPVLDLQKLHERHRRAGGRPELVIDMNGVAFAGSASLSGFLKIHRAVTPEGGRVIFCRVDPMVRDVFRVSHIESLLTFADDLDAAIALARGGAPTSPPTPAAGGDGDGEAKPVPPRRENAGPLRSRRRPPESQGT